MTRTTTLPDPADLQRLLDAPASIYLRLARPEHAAYIYGLRIDPAYNRYLSAPPADVEAQRRYLETYQEREAAGREFYFVIHHRRAQAPCGVVRLYGLEAETFTWGSWILDATKPRLAAAESAMFVYDFAFGALGYDQCHFEVHKENTGVIAFHERFGAVRTGEDADSFQFHLTRAALTERLPHLVRLTGYVPQRLEMPPSSEDPS
jgi:RimJ/RimL family protein N-acetyltransferase